MTIKQIKLDAFTLDVSTPALEKELQKLNTKKDSVIDVNDIQLPAGLTDDKLQKDLLEKAVAAAFVNSGLLTEDKRESLVKFFDLYERVEDLAVQVKDAKSHATVVTETGESSEYIKAGTKSLRFPIEESHQEIKMMTSLLDYKMNDLATDVHDVIHGLTGADETNTPYIGNNRKESDNHHTSPCDHDVLAGFRFDSYHLPAELKGPVEKAAQMYLESVEWLLQFDQAYCFDPNAQPRNAIFSFRGFESLSGLRYIKPGAVNEHATRIFYGCGSDL